MRLDTSQQMRTDMRLRMAPRMIQSMEILQLPLMALQERIDQELSENPVLVDLRDTPAPESDSEEAPATPEEPTTTEFEADGGMDGQDDWSEPFGETHRLSRAAMSEEADRKHDAMQNMASRPRSLHDDLDDQLGFLDPEPTVRTLAQYIIFNLDENGYLNHDLSEMLRDYGGDATMAQAEEALRLIQKLDPLGVGARNLRECLLLQLNQDIPSREILQVLISNHLDDLQQNRLPAIEKKTGIPIDDIKEAMEHLRRLNPRPGARFAPESTQYVVPDLIVEANEHGEYEVRLVDEHTPQLSISRYYQMQLKNKATDAAAREFIQKRIQSARWLIESIEQRRNTLLKVARAIIDHQKDFLDKGPEFIEPLKMQQIADRVHVHVTTVSRAVDDKWVQTPRGIFALKRFFGGGTTTADGEEVAWDTIKQKLLEIIAKEDKQSPLSDEEIVEELGRHGFPVARRTVTKYRRTLRIPSSRQRKQF
ncbi:RNA polymerase factor sigma-54 [Singulisphaera acidiphila]|uniref:RNA polymerase sigma-54 factor n=1 Tax=Singulisphaera acidiphila (strain ATCC BAA-1392 / DSM 18658 / VKM B-2454 / MOB10) TaxID=886293 RepID=L0DA06_SINAD|nr:RNA polymerase factor sigma-54 [Singulisphaera acidiphila]AGA25700.1 RNA polymerase sigma-54 factor [Singulisphaera acidiphila DSM 18658]